MDAVSIVNVIVQGLDAALIALLAYRAYLAFGTAVPLSKPHDSLRRLLSLATLVAVSGSGSALGQAYPSKPIKLIVSAPAGSPPDVSARWLAAKLAPALGQPLVVDNRPGAGGNIGTEAAAKSAPDGYTLVMVHQGTLAFNPHLYARTGYDPIKDFAPVTRTSVLDFVLAVHPDVGANSVSDLIRLAKERPGKLSFGSAPLGTPPHIAEQLFRRMAGIDTVVVPYKGGNFALTDLIAGRLTYTLDGVGITVPHARAGKVRMLAVTGPRRLPFLPDVPTIAESGLPGYSYQAWLGLAAPAGTHRDIVSRLNAETVKVAGSAESREWQATQGQVPASDTPEEFAALIKADYEKWGQLIREAGIKLE